MKCPYCSKEMMYGSIYNGRNPIHWIPNDSKPSVLAFKTAKNSVILRHQTASVLNGYSAEAYYCADCRIVIAKTEE
ncbi:MAG: MarR family transcriptional regulator [Peptococcaceae bacterium]|nr:MarR family transcriptional regulator [Peptococcaceae bacterium]